eukprot:Seg2610.3 transcript_id=Seg2610.3/GoldUCD/mRNA.D3Y31 product="Tachykinin-like peptides receptor 86C" protein_id=Seg2610.3/GoldUCD/D3Y31
MSRLLLCAYLFSASLAVYINIVLSMSDQFSPPGLLTTSKRLYSVSENNEDTQLKDATFSSNRTRSHKDKNVRTTDLKGDIDTNLKLLESEIRIYCNVTEEVSLESNITVYQALNFSSLLDSGNFSCGNMSNATMATLQEPSIESTALTFSNKLATVAFGAILIIGMFGNSFVIYTFGIKFKKRTVTETLLLNLAIVDLLASIVNPLLYIYWIMTRFSRWDFGIIGCKILPPIAPISTTASSAIIIIICIDRYRSIVTPFKNRLSITQVNILSAVGVLASILFYLYYIVALAVVPEGYCHVNEVGSKSYSVPNVTITLFWDIIYILVFVPANARIFTHLKGNYRLKSDARQWQRRKRVNRKVVRMLFAVGLIFAILVFPKDILHLTFTMSWMFPPGIDRSDVLVTLNSWFKVLQVSNSCVNVFIYSQMHDRFKQELKLLLKSICGYSKTRNKRENEATEQGTNLSLEETDIPGGRRGSRLKKISDKIGKRLSPKPKKKMTFNTNGEAVYGDGTPTTPRSQHSKANGNKLTIDTGVIGPSHIIEPLNVANDDTAMLLKVAKPPSGRKHNSTQNSPQMDHKLAHLQRYEARPFGNGDTEALYPLLGEPPNSPISDKEILIETEPRNLGAARYKNGKFYSPNDAIHGLDINENLQYVACPPFPVSFQDSMDTPRVSMYYNGELVAEQLETEMLQGFDSKETDC